MEEEIKNIVNRKDLWYVKKNYEFGFTSRIDIWNINNTPHRSA